MLYRLVLVAGFVSPAAVVALTQDARPPAPTSPRVAEIERKVADAKARVEAAQAALAVLER